MEIPKAMPEPHDREASESASAARARAARVPQAGQSMRIASDGKGGARGTAARRLAPAPAVLPIGRGGLCKVAAPVSSPEGAAMTLLLWASLVSKLLA